MPKPKRGPRLGAGPKHQKQILAGQASDLFRYGRIRTTEAKARMLQPYAEKLITKAKRGDLHARRQVLSQVHDRDVVAWLFEEVAPRFAERNGGYTRVLKLGPRQGDNAPMAIVELVEEMSGAEQIEESRERRSRGLFGRGRRTAEPEPSDELLLDEDLEEEDLEQEPQETGGLLIDESPQDEDEVEPTDELEDEPTEQLPEEPDSAPPPRPSAQGPAQTPTAPAEDPGEPVELADDEPDAGDTTGG